MKFRNLRIKTKQILGFTSILIILAGVNIFSIYGLNSLKSDIDEFEQNWLPRTIAITEINTNSSNLRREQLQYAFAIDEKLKDKEKKLYIKYIDKINENIDKYEFLKAKYTGSTDYYLLEDSIYASFDQNWERYLDLSFEYEQLLNENKNQEALELMNNQARKVFNDYSTDLSVLVDICAINVVSSANHADTTYKITHFITLLLLIIAVILSAVLTIVLVRLILVPVYRLEKASKEVANGKLDVEVPVTSNDEMGNLSLSFNQMTSSLKEAKEKEKIQAERLKMQWEVLTETNQELEENSKRLEKQKIKIENKNTQLQSTLQQLKEAQNQLVQSEKMASVGQLTAGIAHEINNPINFISSNISPLKRDLDDLLKLLSMCTNATEKGDLQNESDKIKKYKEEIEYDMVIKEIKQLLSGIEEGARRTMEIVKGLRNFSRLDEGEKKLSDINEGIESTLLMLRNQLKNRIEVVKEFGGLPQLLCYPGKLNQVFMNIINNASQSIEAEGKIVISTSYQDNNIHVSIKDTGKGMSKKVTEHIFEPFYTTKDVGQGTGLGLSISYGIIQEHKGEIKVKSELGKGTEFLITLPLEE
jgi:signal transduction histidine kinase